ncbi:RNA polymerase sigma factor [Chitinophaga nivalis]|uniref:Sigma-70 family RNA polymerase sigma factor n=1 Tax=Chitinophaga nivalis TaxID=2991709 RepID=A0ABT3INM7_9BACT|nr:sigma-70 family RNA polymerase sigma factor [Chitinophaga nivalis]MCW3464726.1 sigma-70 family RNA polymerase sigma factor [Chitinophaga nivalis]MCW3485583.1 sigma-70 family RNA polymerase sigma factor [Chitinophaga nivalis]
MEKLSDNKLLLLIKEGNHPAFTTLVNRYWEQLYVYTKSKVRQEADAQDIVQEIFISCWNNRATLYTGQNDRLTAYLYQAARYAIISYFSRPGNTIYNESLLTAISEHQTENITETALQLKELEQQIRIEVNKLPERLRTPYLLSRDANLSLKDIAQQMSLSEQTVKNNISSALRVLRTRLYENNDLITILVLITHFSS